MQNYRISKFDPKKRDLNGIYIDQNEWSAILEPNPNNTPAYDEYVKVENTYLDTINLILSEININTLTISSLNNYCTFENFQESLANDRLKELLVTYNEIMELHDGLILSLDRIDIVSRLILREVVWMDLISEKVMVVFGYDYNIFIKCPKLSNFLIENIHKNGLYIDNWESDRIFTREN